MIANLRKAVPHILIAFIFIAYVLIPVVGVHAQNSFDTCATNPSAPGCDGGANDDEQDEDGGDMEPPDDGTPNEDGGDIEAPDQGSVSLINPLKFGSIEEFLFAIIDIILVFAVPLIVLFIMYAGFKFVTAQGNATAVTDARKQLQWAVIGGLIVLGARIIYELIENTVATFGT